MNPLGGKYMDWRKFFVLLGICSILNSVLTLTFCTMIPTIFPSVGRTMMGMQLGSFIVCLIMSARKEG